jgi:trypsin
MNGDSNNRRWRGVVVVLTLLMVFAMIADPFFPSTAEAKPKRYRGVDAQVIGGQAVPQGTFTFMAFVLFEIEDDLFQCGGTLIDPTHVLTAAHCTDDFDGSPLDPSAFEISVGKANLNELGPENERGVAEVFQHPDWDQDVSLDNDVAVLELDEAVPSSIANPIPFADSGQTGLDEPGKEAVVAGWGITGSGNTTDQLQEATLKLASGGTCTALFGSQFQPDIMLCASFPGRDSCFGDSGGPLIVKEKVGTEKKKRKKRKHGKHRKHRHKKRKPIFASVQTGIVSFGSDQCDTAGAYTRITAPGINDFIVDAVNS